jgi:hypothetical protein
MGRRIRIAPKDNPVIHIQNGKLVIVWLRLDAQRCATQQEQWKRRCQVRRLIHGKEMSS